MERGRGPLVLFVVILLSALLWIGFVAVFNSGIFVGFSPENPQCSDNIDNDNDCYCDYSDFASCSFESDICENGIIGTDHDCYSATDDSEQPLFFAVEGQPNDEFSLVIFSERGEIFHYGDCGPYYDSQGEFNCEAQIISGDFFKIRNSQGEVTAWINKDGFICVSEFECGTDPDPDCETASAAFRIKNDLDETVAYFNENGEICHEGVRSDNVPTVVFDLP